MDGVHPPCCGGAPCGAASSELVFGRGATGARRANARCVSLGAILTFRLL